MHDGGWVWPLGLMMFGWVVLAVLVMAGAVWLATSLGRPPTRTGTTTRGGCSANATPGVSWMRRSTTGGWQVVLINLAYQA